jgi:TetR/AcrR family transcriptional regulator, cholesterol catabolism regulator
MQHSTRRAEQAPGGGTTDTKSARTRVRILDAAAKVLSRKGYAGMRLSDVAEAADLQAPAIYYYFDSREDLIEEVMWVGIADMREHLTRILDKLPPGTPPIDRILVAAEAHLRHELEISDYTTASIRNAGQVPDKIRKRQLAEEARYGEIWRDLMRSAAAEGALRADLDPYIAQMLVLGSLNWTAEWWSPKRGKIDSVVANAKSFIQHAISA